MLALIVALPMRVIADDSAVTDDQRVDALIERRRAAVQADPDDGWAWRRLGELYSAKGEFANAVIAYEHAATKLANNVSVWNDLGMAYFANNQLEKAATALARAIKLDLSFPVSRANLGRVRYEQGNYKEAIIEYAAAVKLDRKRAGWWSWLALAYRDENRWDEAIDANSKAAALEPKLAIHAFNLASTYHAKVEAEGGPKTKLLRADLAKAIKEYERAAALDPSNASPWRGLGYAYKSVDPSIDLKPKGGQRYGNSLFALGRSSETSMDWCLPASAGQCGVAGTSCSQGSECCSGACATVDAATGAPGKCQ